MSGFIREQRDHHDDKWLLWEVKNVSKPHPFPSIPLSLFLSFTCLSVCSHFAPEFVRVYRIRDKSISCIFLSLEGDKEPIINNLAYALNLVKKGTSSKSIFFKLIAGTTRAQAIKWKQGTRGSGPGSCNIAPNCSVLCSIGVLAWVRVPSFISSWL